MEKLYSLIKNKDAKIGVVGIGRVGLPMAISFAKVGFKVIGYDVNSEYVKMINNGEIPFKEDGMNELLPNLIKNKKMLASDNFNDLENTNIIIITVGTPLTDQHQADMTGYIKALNDIKKYVKGKLIISRTTGAPNSFRNYLKPILEGDNLEEGQDFWAAVCPERIVEGKALIEINNLPEIVGVDNDESFKLTSELYLTLNQNKVINRARPIEAELAKLFCNVYRYVNFALANEFGMICERLNVDAYNTIMVANNGYSRGGIPKPGLTGGPCLSKDGYFLNQDTLSTDFIMTAWRTNEFMPNYLVERVKKSANEILGRIHGINVALLGLSFKADSDDIRYSPSIAMKNILINSGMNVRTHDPYIKETLDLENAVIDANVIIVSVNHKQFYELEDLINKSKVSIVLDCWGILNKNKIDKKIRLLRIGS